MGWGQPTLHGGSEADNGCEKKSFQTFQSALTGFHRMCQAPSMRQVSYDSRAMASTAGNVKAVTSHRTPKEEALLVGTALSKKRVFLPNEPNRKIYKCFCMNNSGKILSWVRFAKIGKKTGNKWWKTAPGGCF
jgi:hypothetical protein